MVPTATAEESPTKRKKVKTKLIPREHAGKITEPYAITERLIKEVEAFHPLKDAKIVMLWKWGWRPDADGVMKRASLKKASELEKELGVHEYDYAMLLCAELWKETKISDESKEIDIFHVLCHAAPEMDTDGEQRFDDRGRACWRLRKHPIQEFPEVIKKYGLAKVTGLNAAAIAALDDVKRRQEVKDDKIAERPILAKAEREGLMQEAKSKKKINWRKTEISAVPFKTSDSGKLLSAGIETLGDLQDLMQKEATWWHKSVPGVGTAAKDRIEDVFNRYVMDSEFGTEGA